MHMHQLMYQLYKHIKRLHYKNKNNLSFRIVHWFCVKLSSAIHFLRLQQVNEIRNRFDLIDLMLLM